MQNSIRQTPFDMELNIKYTFFSICLIGLEVKQTGTHNFAALCSFDVLSTNNA
jgi:hypothetical protein